MDIHSPRYVDPEEIEKKVWAQYLKDSRGRKEAIKEEIPAAEIVEKKEEKKTE